MQSKYKLQLSYMMFHASCLSLKFYYKKCCVKIFPRKRFLVILARRSRNRPKRQVELSYTLREQRFRDMRVLIIDFTTINNCARTRVL